MDYRRLSTTCYLLFLKILCGDNSCGSTFQSQMKEIFFFLTLNMCKRPDPHCQHQDEALALITACRNLTRFVGTPLRLSYFPFPTLATLNPLDLGPIPGPTQHPTTSTQTHSCGRMIFSLQVGPISVRTQSERVDRQELKLLCTRWSNKRLRVLLHNSRNCTEISQHVGHKPDCQTFAV